MKRKFPTHPIVGVGAVILHHDSVLLVQRATPPMEGEWTLPGGVVETGESLEEAVRREIKEETNLDIQVGPLLELFERIQRDERDRVAYHYIIADYLAKKTGGKLRPATDVRQAKFVPRSDLAGFRLTEKVLHVISRAFGISRLGRRL